MGIEPLLVLRYHPTEHAEQRMILTKVNSYAVLDTV